jgi:hypothetical protein
LALSAKGFAESSGCCRGNIMPFRNETGFEKK